MLAALAGGAPRWLFVGGKGGVGKTTVAATLAITIADAGFDVLALSTDPAHSLGDAFGVQLGADPLSVPEVPRLRAMELDAERERDRWLAEHREALATLLDRGTFLERGEIEELLGLALPGLDEVAAMLHLMRLASEGGGGDELRVIVDTAPTGHTLRLLDAPALAQRWLHALDVLDRRHDAVARALTGAVPDDDARRFARTLRADVDSLAERLHDPERTGMLLVATAEPVVVAETVRYARALRDLGVALHSIVVNHAQQAPRGLQEASNGAPVDVLPTVAPEPHGVERLRAFGQHGSPRPQVNAETAAARVVAGERWLPPMDRVLYVVGGKGGVGKSTVASALALQLAREREGDVLLLGLDPAGSLGDVWEIQTGTDAVSVPGVPRLWVRQLHATRAWRELRAEYEAQARRLAGELTGAGAAADELLSLAPPGLDELMAVVELVDLAEGAPYVAVVLDTAPTGHLLRLLDTPELALRWAHATMRLLLRYREVAGLGDLAERLLRFARGVRDLQALLRDESRRYVIAVALPESLSVAETRRLLTWLGEHEMAAGALLVNRALLDGRIDGDAARHVAELALEQEEGEVIVAPQLDAGPRGAAALANFVSTWRRAVVQAFTPPAVGGARA